MPLRSFLWFTASTLLGCLLLVFFLDQPLAWFSHRYLNGAGSFFLACTTLYEDAYSVLMWPIKGIPLLFSGSLVGFLVLRVGLRQPWANVFLLLLLTHLASQISANLLKVATHRLRPEVLVEKGYTGPGFWQAGPNNNSFPSAHVAIIFSLFWPFAVVFPRYRIWLLVLPGIIGVGRLILDQHYVSDVWFSVWLVIAWAELFSAVGMTFSLLYHKILPKKLVN
jgi:membrane-associated phospholipid phosphatase